MQLTLLSTLLFFNKGMNNFALKALAITTNNIYELSSPFHHTQGCEFASKNRTKFTYELKRTEIFQYKSILTLYQKPTCWTCSSALLTETGHADTSFSCVLRSVLSWDLHRKLQVWGCQYILCTPFGTSSISHTSGVSYSFKRYQCELFEQWAFLVAHGDLEYRYLSLTPPRGEKSYLGGRLTLRWLPKLTPRPVCLGKQETDILENVMFMVWSH